MRNKWWTLWAAIIIAALLMPAAAQAAASQAAPVKVKSIAFELEFDGKTIKLPEGQYLFVYKGTSYVPVRFISYALQKSVKWDSKSKKVSVAEPSANELTVLKEYLMNATGTTGQASSVGGVLLKASPIAASFVFDGQVRELPAGQAAYILNNSVYVPVRFMSESIGTEIKWDAAGHRITGESQAYRSSQQSDAVEEDKGNNESDIENNEEVGAGTVPGGSTPVSGGGNGAVVPAKPTEQEIKAEAEKKLQALYDAAKAKFLSLLQQYSNAADEAARKSIYSQGEAYLTEVTTQFEQLMTDTENKLTSNGYSTSIINEYRAKFQSEIEAGREMIAVMTGK
ncbi:stalk domain-containing protein [Paenibacillus xylaniclasticus]|uniref:stalk domain-containing protein n=1 Tax=Paenibacillus xylaniclasticus TaxID=588083 RepID=UPI000FDB4822|nr:MULTISPECIES: stalk domain-containing protein [Paenibacillus]GFN32761.1 hypothetical protein PCURB6_30210 [Paenibacillus curdlanolyticus]